MTNLTIRNIPSDIMEKIKTLSEMERRSLNSEMLILLERGLFSEMKSIDPNSISKEMQIKVWSKLANKWQDKRKTETIIHDIYSSRSPGREVDL